MSSFPNRVWERTRVDESTGRQLWASREATPEDWKDRRESMIWLQHRVLERRRAEERISRE